MATPSTFMQSCVTFFMAKVDECEMPDGGVRPQCALDCWYENSDACGGTEKIFPEIDTSEPICYTDTDALGGCCKWSVGTIALFVTAGLVGFCCCVAVVWCIWCPERTCWQFRTARSRSETTRNRLL